jgi:Flp pilus assembly protein TadG
MRSIVSRHRQGGAVIVTAALTLLFLLGFMGIALDFGRLFVVKTELQTAMDSCALAAAQELDGNATTSLTRARSAGKTAGNLNRVNMQSVNWSGQGQLVDAEITFKDAGYSATADSANARYAQCQHTQPAIQMLLLPAMGAFSGNTAAFPNTKSVTALAVATRASAQSTCPVPIALKPKTVGSLAPNYGYVVGEWITLINAPGGGSANGQIGWANLDGSNNASQTQAEMNGSCGTRVGDTLGTPGVQATVADVWNGRFGIYKNNNGPSQNNPDFTGYAYTAANWPAGQNAYNGAPGAGAHASAQNFVTKRAAFASCANTGISVKGANSCESITGLNLSGGFQNPLAAPGNAAGGHRDFGRNRRIVTVPVINAASGVIDYACMLMLQPLSIPMSDAKLEFIGNAGALNSPCTTSGQAGGPAGGPLVPVLVR